MNVVELKNLGARLAPWVATAAVAMVALWLTGRMISLRAENQTLRTERMLAEVAYKLGQSQLAERTLLAENMINRLGRKLQRAEDLARLQIFALVQPAGDAPEAPAIVVWDPEQQAGLLVVEKLPIAQPGHDYQLWVVNQSDSRSVSAGVVPVKAAGRVVVAFKLDQPVAHAAAFALRLEEKSGAPAATGPVVLVSR